VVALVTVLVIVCLSLLVTRVATMALTLTGMSTESARFQARSALTGVGFTTSEAETVVDHPVRRRIVMLLMLVGGAGIVTAIATLMLSFVGADRAETLTRAGVLVGGLALLVVLSRNAVVDRWLSRAIARGLQRWTDLEARDYARLLHLGPDFAVHETAVREGDWLAGGELGELDVRAEGVVVLGIERAGGGYVGAPVRETAIRPGDTAILYGPQALLCRLDRRPAGPEGDADHERAVAEQRERRSAEVH
jgi:hypothetical protein